MGIATLPTEFTAFSGSKNGIIQKTIKTKSSLGVDEVAVKVSHTGVCGTDLHHTHDDMVLGHEGIGIVQQVGAKVTKVKLGDRVGFGYVWGGCGQCKDCKDHRYFYCKVAPRQYALNDPEIGSFSNFAILPETMLVQIPENISSGEAAPLMCAGITVFAPLHRNGVRPGTRIGITGIGGLGHLAIQFAAALGAQVVVFSTSESKRAEAISFGAHEFYVSSDLANKKPTEGLDFLMVTGTRFPDWNVFFPMLNHHAKVLMVGFSDEKLELPFWQFILNEISVIGCCTSTPEEFETMLKFAAEKGVRPLVEEFSMDEAGVKQAVAKLVDGSIRYRGVLKV